MKKTRIEILQDDIDNTILYYIDLIDDDDTKYVMRTLLNICRHLCADNVSLRSEINQLHRKISDTEKKCKGLDDKIEHVETIQRLASKLS